MRRRFRWSPEQKRLVELTTFDEERKAHDVMGDLPAYTSPIDGRLVDGRVQRREDLKRSGCRPYEDGERQAIERQRASEDAELTRSVDKTVERWFAESSSRQHELLEQALRAGTDVQYTRK